MSTTPTPTPAPKKSIYAKIAAGLEWFGKEIGKGLADLPKVIVLAEDVEQDAQEVLPEVITVVQDAGSLVAATAKDSGKFLVSFAALTGAVSLAIANKALNISADTAVVTAFENFCSDFQTENVQDVLTAWHQLASDTAKLDATVVAALKKLKADA